PADQRACRALRPRRHLCGDLLRDPGQRPVLHVHRTARAMAHTGQLTASPLRLPGLSRVTLLRIAIILAVLALWEAVAASGLLFRDVVPSLTVIARALASLLGEEGFYWNLGVTAGEVGTGLVIGGLAGLIVGIVLGGSRFLSRAFEPYIYY